MDIFTHSFVVKNRIVCLKKAKKTEKRPGMAHFLLKNHEPACTKWSTFSRSYRGTPPRGGS